MRMVVEGQTKTEFRSRVSFFFHTFWQGRRINCVCLVDLHDSMEPRKARFDNYIDRIALLDFPTPPLSTPLQRPLSVNMSAQQHWRDSAAIDRGVPENDLSRLLYPGLSSTPPSAQRGSGDIPDRGNAPPGTSGGWNAWGANEPLDEVKPAVAMPTPTTRRSPESTGRGKLQNELGHSRNDSSERRKLQVFGPDKIGSGDFPSLGSNFELTSERRPSVDSVVRTRAMNSSSKLERLLGTSAYASSSQLSHSRTSTSGRGSNDCELIDRHLQRTIQC